MQRNFFVITFLHQGAVFEYFIKVIFRIFDYWRINKNNTIFKVMVETSVIKINRSDCCNMIIRNKCLLMNKAFSVKINFYSVVYKRIQESFSNTESN